MKKKYSTPITETINIIPSPLLQGSRVYTDDPQSVETALVKKNDLTFNVWDDDWNKPSE